MGKVIAQFIKNIRLIAQFIKNIRWLLSLLKIFDKII
jgi:hypothetical protein